MSNRTIFNELGENRVINPRSGFSQFVDLSNNQTHIAGIKTFLNDLITNGSISCTSLSAGSGSISTSGIINGGVITGTSLSAGTGTISTSGNITGGSLNLKNESNQNCLIITPSASAPTYRLQLFGFPSGIKKLYYSIGDELGVIELSSTIWKINGLGDATFNSLSVVAGGTITTTGNINGGVITGTSLSITGSGTISTSGIINGGEITGTSLSAGSGTISTSGTIKSNTINCNTGTIISSTSIWNYKSSGGSTYILLDPTLSATNRLQIYSEVGYTKYLYFNTSNVLGFYKTAGIVNNIWSIDGDGNILTIGNINNGTGTISTTGHISGGTITGTSLSTGSGTISTSGSISGVGITGRTLDLKNVSAITNISLDATLTSGNRLVIYGVASGTKYLYYNTSNNIGVFNTSTGTSVWSIDGTTGNIVTIGSYTVGSLSATSFLCNSMSPLSGTVINIGATSEFNFLKSVGVSRIRLYPTSTAGDIMQITRVSDATFTSGYWYFNNSGNLGYNTSGATVWELLNTGGMNLTDLVSSGYLRSTFLYAYTFSTYQNVINMNNLTTNTGISAISIISQYCNFIHPSITPTIFSKYMFIVPDTGGNFTQYINNVSGRVLQSDWANVVLKTDYNFQCFGRYNYIEGSQAGDICGHWINRTDTLGNPVTNNSNNWVTMGGMENNNASVIASGVPNGGSNRRVFTWLIENTNNSGKALGLACNRTNTPNSVINTLSQASGFALLGFFATNKTGGAYSFTGEHSSMVCDEEYDDLMNYNTDDFIGMVVCSSGKIYNLPYDCDGNTYEKQVDNIKSVDSQPMTRLSKKYKDKAVLGVISHIEKVGKNRNDLNATSWTGCMALDKDERRRIRVASIGEGGIWITNEYGNIENGDYITTSIIAGYSTKQDDDLMHNYTIAKATMDCVFDIEKPDEYKTKYLGQGIYASYIACTYHSG